MAIYHMSIKIFSRGKGASAVCKAAYRAAEALRSEYDGETYDYTSKSGIVHKEILLSENAPMEYKDRYVLWNSVEQSERYKTAQLAREVEVALPRELTIRQNIELAKKYAQEIFVNNGMCADICVHDNGTGNPHAHIMLTMRPIDRDGTWGQKSRRVNGKKVPAVDWNDREKAEQWRKAWADYCNAALARQKENAKIDHRSYRRQGKEQIPTVHLGSSAWLEKKNIKTDKGNINRKIGVSNNELRQIGARLKKLKAWLYSKPFDSFEKAPSMSDVLRNIDITEQFRSRARKVADLQAFAKTVNFLMKNNLNSIDELADKVTDMQQLQYDLAGEIKKQERRLSTLDLHLHNVEIYNKHKPVYQEYLALPKNQREAFKAKNAASLKAHDTAHKYITGVLNGRTSIPVTAWKTEREQLLIKRYELCDKYYKLKDDVKSVELLRKGAEKTMGDTMTERKTARKRDKML